MTCYQSSTLCIVMLTQYVHSAISMVTMTARYSQSFPRLEYWVLTHVHMSWLVNSHFILLIILYVVFGFIADAADAELASVEGWQRTYHIRSLFISHLSLLSNTIRAAHDTPEEINRRHGQNLILISSLCESTTRIDERKEWDCFKTRWTYLVTSPLKLHQRWSDGGILIVFVNQLRLSLDCCELEQHLLGAR